MSNAILIEEWKTLRDEIRQKQQFEYRLILTSATGNLAIFSFAFSLQDISPVNAIVALLPIIFTTIVYLWLLKNIYSITRIVLYMTQNLEKEVGLNWETWIQSNRRKIQPGGKIKTSTNIHRLYYSTFLWISLGISVVSIWARHLSSLFTGSATLYTLPDWWVCFFLSIGVVIFGVVWHWTTHQFWIKGRITDIEDINQQLQESVQPSNKPKDKRKNRD
jgi:hypothetical protein